MNNKIIQNLLFIAAILFSASMFADDINPAMPSILNEVAGSSFREPSNSAGIESIDPFTGSLNIVNQDLSLPSNGGLDIVINRVYNSKTSLTENATPNGWNLMGVGWDMHFGRIWVTPNYGIGTSSDPTNCRTNTNPNISYTNPVLEHANGNRETLFNTIVSPSGQEDFDSAYITKSRWVGRCLPISSGNGGLMVISPDGVKYTYNFLANGMIAGGPASPVYNVTKIEHPNGTKLDIVYHPVTGSTSSAAPMAAIDYIENSEGRKIKFKYSDLNSVTKARLISIEILGSSPTQKWTYNYEDVPGPIGGPNLGYRYLKSVTRPDNKKIHYEYNTYQGAEIGTIGNYKPGNYQLKQVKTPSGLQVDYTYDGVNFPLRVGAAAVINGMPREVNVISKKVISGSVNKSGTWNYRYYPEPVTSNNDLLLDLTVVDGPNECVQYKHRMILSSVNTLGGNRWRMGNLVSKHIGSSCSGSNLSAELESTVYEWDKQMIGPQLYLKPVSGAGSVNPDLDVFAPIMTKQTITRDGTSYVTTYSNHDEFGNPETVTETSPQGSRITQFTYLGDISKWIVNKVKTQTVLNVSRGGGLSSNSSVVNEYFSNGNLKSTDANGVTSSYTYHTIGSSKGEVKTVTDPRGKITTYTNYEAGQAKNEAMPESVTISRDIDNIGRVIFEIDGENNKTQYSYDTLNNVKTITTAKTSDVNVDFTYNYNAVTGLTRTLSRGAGFSETSIYDGLGNLEKVSISGGETIFNKTDYDENGRVKHKFLPNSTTKKITYFYDALGRVIRMTYPDGAFLSLTYLSGNKVRKKDERGNLTTYEYRSYGNPNERMLLKITEPESVTTVINRNKLGAILTVTQDGINRSYFYDTRFYMDSEIHPEVGTIDYVRDALGNMTDRKVGTSAFTKYVYDDLSRLEKIDYASASTADIIYEYFKDGLIKKAIKGGTQWDYLYDDNKNLENETLTVNGNSFALNYTNNSLDHMSSLVYPSGLSVSYNPDGLGRAQTVGSFVSNVDYFANGQIKKIEFGNGVITDYTQDPDRLFPKKFTTSKGVISLLDTEYFYDAAGNIKDITDAINPVNNMSFTYDGINRLETAVGPWGSGNHTYDKTGNLKSKNLGAFSLTYNMNPATNRLDSISGSKPYTFQYDVYGNVESNGAHTFNYDEAYNLTRVNNQSTGAEVASYELDANNLRVAEYKNSSVSKYSVYASNGSRMYEEETVASLAKDFIYLNGQLIADRAECMDANFDGDGDGIPSCTESSAGLDPSDPNDATADQDNDGLDAATELGLGTNPFNADSDSDGFSDGYEVANGLNPLLNDASADLDSDGLTNMQEQNLGTNPNNSDTDSDQMSDGYEVSNGLNPLVNDAAGDVDNDGLTNLQEFNLGTMANDADTDNDGLIDSYEVQYGQDPLVNDSSNDGDADGFTNLQENQYGTDPSNPDTDGDGQLDGVDNNPTFNPAWLVPVITLILG